MGLQRDCWGCCGQLERALSTVLIRDFHVRGRTQAKGQSSDYDLRWMVPTQPAHAVDVHTHADAHLILVLEGAYQTSAKARKSGGAKAPLLVLNPPRTEHQDCFHPDQALPHARFFSMTLSPALWLRWQDAIDLPSQASSAQGAELQALAQAWLRLCAAPWTTCADMEEGLTAAFASFSPTSMANGSQSSVWVARLRQQLRAQVMEGVEAPCLGDIAREFGVHPVYMARAFRKNTGVSPADYVRGAQLDKAVWLLRSTSLPLAELAQVCHYFDQAHLAHAFKAAYGVTPGAYRLHTRH